MALVSLDQIAELAGSIARAYRPDRIILFGSYAYGTPHEGSDVDLLVVMPHEGSSLRVAAEVLNRAAPMFGVDLLVKSPETMRRRLAMGDGFICDVVNRGTVLHEAGNGGVA